MFGSDIALLAARLARAAAVVSCLAGMAPAGAADRATDPAALYHNYCSVCHGDRGDGQSRARGSLNPAPKDFTTPLAQQELTRDRMIAAVKGGIPGTAMVGWQTQLSDAQIASVVDYVRENFMRAGLGRDGSRGRQIYARTCSVCHGDRGNGSMWASANLRPAPRDFSSPQARAELTRERMLQSLAGGRPGTAMSGYARQMSAEDMVAVVDYIRSAFMRVDADKGISGTHARTTTGASASTSAASGAPSPHAAARPAPAASAPPAALPQADLQLPMPRGLVGNAAAGGKFYEANCATCHGSKGDGQGPRAYFINPKPRVFTSAQSRALLNRPAIYAGVAEGRRGSEMPAWDKVITPQQIADVSEYVFRSFIQPGARDAAAAR